MAMTTPTKTIYRDKHGDLWRCVCDNAITSMHKPFVMLKMCNDGNERTIFFNRQELDSLIPVAPCALVHFVHIEQVKE